MSAARSSALVRVASSVVLGFLCCTLTAENAPAEQLSGSLAGSVRSAGGIPQMGATVLVFNRLNRLAGQAMTNASGDFSFDRLGADIYSVRVNLVSFLPAIRDNILVQPGMQSVLAIDLASVLGTLELVYAAPKPNSLISDDWKWVLRSSMTTRPVLRFLPELDLDGSVPKSSSSTTVFSDTHGMVSVSSGDTSPFSYGNQRDLGTSFALATSFFGANQLKVSGNIGYAGSTGLPTAGFRTSFSRSDMPGPQLKLSMQQVALRSRGGGALLVGQGGTGPMLRTMSVTLLERRKLTDELDIDYGASLDSVTYLDRLNYVSPFLRLSYRVGSSGALEFGYSAGAPPVELLLRGEGGASELRHDMAALSVLPRVSLRDGRPEVQRTRNLELGYRFAAAGNTITLAAYHEAVGNAALTMSGVSGLYPASDLLPDLGSNSSVFNIGKYSRVGYTASLTRKASNYCEVTLAAGRGGVLVTDGRLLQTADPAELRSAIRSSFRQWVRGRVAAVTPYSNTKVVTSYEWTDYDALTPGHVFITQNIYPETGLNVKIRQPIPSFGNMLSGRLEALAELRNLLAQGYLPLSTADGQRLILSHSPRALRGGVSFVF